MIFLKDSQFEVGAATTHVVKCLLMYHFVIGYFSKYPVMYDFAIEKYQVSCIGFEFFHPHSLLNFHFFEGLDRDLLHTTKASHLHFPEPQVRPPTHK